MGYYYYIQTCIALEFRGVTGRREALRGVVVG
jgi:hypothetical protein